MALKSMMKYKNKKSKIPSSVLLYSLYSMVFIPEHHYSVSYIISNGMRITSNIKRFIVDALTSNPSLPGFV